MTALGRRGQAIAWLVTIAVAVLLPLGLGNYRVYVLQEVVLVAVLALGLNLFQGYCGQANFGISGFVAFGAYGSGLIEVKLDVHPFLTIVPAVLIGTAVAYLLSHVFLRLRHMSQALGTVAFALTVFSLLNTAISSDWGGGDAGFSLPAIELFGERMDYRSTYYLLLVLLAVAFVACVLVVRGPIGRAWTAIREDETAAAASGVDVLRFMRLAFVLNGALAALGGVMMAMQSRYLAPDNVSLSSNILVLLVVVVGGAGTNVGMLVGSVVMILMSEVIADHLDFPTLAQGIVLFVVMRFLPRGLWPHLRDGIAALRGRAGRSDRADEAPLPVLGATPAGLAAGQRS